MKSKLLRALPLVFGVFCLVFLSSCSTPLKQLAPLVEQLKSDQAKFKLTVVAAGISVTLEREMPTNYIPPWTARPP